MTQFYEVRTPAGERAWFAALEDAPERRLFVWVANTGQWHWNAPLQADFYAGEPEMEYVSIGAAATAEGASHEAKINQVTGRLVLEALTAAPAVSSARLGLPTRTSPRPTRAPGLVEALRRAPHTWVVLRSYPSDKGASARAMASEIRTGKKKALRELGQLEARTKPAGELINVEIRVAPGTQASAPSDVPDSGTVE